MSFLTGLILSAIIGFAAYYKKSLSLGGFITAIITGALVYMFGGIYFYVLLMGFFISSSLLTKLNESKKKDIEKLQSKSGSRDSSQVLTNILPAVIYGAIYYFTGKEIFLVAYASFFAASNADTWASEIGVLSGKLPVSIITLKELPRGISGGVSRLGIIASLLGACFSFNFLFYRLCSYVRIQFISHNLYCDNNCYRFCGKYNRFSARGYTSGQIQNQ